LTGTLTGNRNIIVPATVQQYWITNATTGSFTLTVKTSAGTGITVVQGDAQILYCNGTNVVLGQSGSSITTPVSIANGGTGATTASGARVNLGGTSTGVAVFTATDAAAARSAISAISTAEATNIAIQYAVALG
jgi:outer membrane lipoprotein-sorting protein